jgi:hypothetical protein
LINKHFNKLEQYSIIFFIGVLFFQLIRLSSDPSPLFYYPDSIDEGYWMHSARSKIITGLFINDGFSLPYVGAPLYSFLIYVVFSLFGVSFVTARLVSLLALWLIMIMLYFIFRSRMKKLNALLSAAMFGLCHTVLIYGRWASPVMLETAFLTAFMLFYIMGLHRKTFYYYLAGASVAFAILAKLSAILFLVPLVIFIGIDLLRKNLKFRNLIKGITGFLAVGIPFIVFFVIPQFDNYVIFFDQIGSDKVMSVLEIIKSFVLSIKGIALLKNPDSILIMIAVMFYFIDLTFRVSQNGIVYEIKKISEIELLSIVWIIGTVLALSINGDLHQHRRQLHLLVPSFILAVNFILNKRKDIFNNLNKYFKFFFIILVSLPISYYLVSVFTSSQIRIWFDISTDIINKIRLLLFLLPLGLYLSYLFISGKKIFIKKILISSFVCISISLNLLWYTTATYTLRDASNKIAEIASKGMYFTGEGSFKLAVNTLSYPIWHILEYGDATHNNFWFGEKMKEEKFLVSDFQYGYFNKIHRRLGIVDKNPSWINSALFDSSKVRHLFDINLSPFPFTNEYREGYSLYIVNP